MLLHHGPKLSRIFSHLRKPLTLGLLGLASWLILSGCGPEKPVIQTVVEVRNVYPVVPANFLNCSPEPVPGVILTDVQLAQFTEAVRLAGEDCRARLSSVRQTVAGWPK